MSREITIRVPGSTSNLGPGYDALGVALSVFNDVTVSPRDADTPFPEHKMVAETASRFFEASRVKPHGFTWEIEGQVPISRGLGSSVTLRLGLLAGLNEMAGSPLSRERLFEICTIMEGHPDNAGPAAFGGFFVSAGTGQYFRFEVDTRLKFVLLVPEVEVLTDVAREILPKQLDRVEAVASCGNACAITAAFASREYEKLQGGFEDYLHQPFRESLNPGLMDVIDEGTRAGALGGFLSGSGSTIACLALETHANSVAKAMETAYASHVAECRTLVLTADNRGVHRVGEP